MSVKTHEALSAPDDESKVQYDNIQIIYDNIMAGYSITRFDIPLRETIHDEEILTVNFRSLSSNWSINRSLLREDILIPIRVISFKAEWNQTSNWHDPSVVSGDITGTYKWASWWSGQSIDINEDRWFDTRIITIGNGQARFNKGEIVNKEKFFVKIVNAANAIYDTQLLNKDVIYASHDSSVQPPEDHPQNGVYYRTKHYNSAYYDGYCTGNRPLTKSEPLFSVVQADSQIGMTMFRVCLMPIYRHENAEANYHLGGQRCPVIIVFFMVDLIGKNPFQSYIYHPQHNDFYSYVETDVKKVAFAETIGLPADILISTSAISLIRNMEMKSPWENVLMTLNFGSLKNITPPPLTSHRFVDISCKPVNGHTNNTFEDRSQWQRDPWPLVFGQYRSVGEYHDRDPSQDNRYANSNIFWLNKIWTLDVVYKLPDNAEYEPYVMFTPCLFTNEEDATPRPLKKYERVYFGSADGYYIHDDYFTYDYGHYTWWYSTPLTPYGRADFNPFGLEMSRYKNDDYPDVFLTSMRENVYGIDDRLFLEIDDETETYNYVNGSRSTIIADLTTTDISIYQPSQMLVNKNFEDILVFDLARSELIATYPQYDTAEFGIIYLEGYVFYNEARSFLFPVSTGNFSLPLSLLTFSAGRNQVAFRIRNKFGQEPRYGTLDNSIPYIIIHVQFEIYTPSMGSSGKPVVMPAKPVSLGLFNKTMFSRPYPFHPSASRFKKKINKARRLSTVKSFI